MTRYKIIVNPISGRGAGAESVQPIHKELQAHQLDYELVLTERPWHAAELAIQAVKDGFGAVVAVGGDGTANEVINGLMQAKKQGFGEAAMGHLPVGRGNDYGYGIGVPTTIPEGCRVLAQDRRLRIDIGLVTGGLFPQGRYFGNGVGIGFDAVVGFEAVKLKRLSGFPSYIVAALKTIFLYYKAPLVEVDYDGVAIQVPVLMVSVMNGRRLGGGFMLAPNGKIYDGLFDLTLAREVSRPTIFSLLFKFMAGTQAGHPAVSTHQARSIKVKALKGVLPAHSDGETLCIDANELTLEIIPRALEVLTSLTEA
jgi:YegS/Rv2252/BmrU family lipid kinase